MQKGTLLSLLLTGSLMVGCGSSSTNSAGGGAVNLPALGGGTVSGRTLVIQEPEALSLERDGDKVDTLDVEGFDASGQRIFGPVRVPLAVQMSLTNVPEGVTTLELDYLRNGGFMLFRAFVDVNRIGLILNPSQQAVALDDTDFEVVPDGNGGFRLIRRHNNPGVPSKAISARSSEENFRIKGVCYSPTPINMSNKDAPAVGDLFWDSFKTAAGNNNIYGWAAYWLNFFDPGIGGNSRADLDKIRSLGANTIRLYSCISYQLGGNGQFVDQNDPNTHRFSHKQFLDACYDHNSERSLHVIVDIPMPDACFQYHIKEATEETNPTVRAQLIAQRAQQIAWWEDNFRKTVEDLSKHPAVIGFNIMNEQDAARSAHPNAGAGPSTDETDYFYSQSAKYAGIVKSIDSTKLCGWGFHDSPDLVVFGKQWPASGPKYLEQMSNFDYWGVNSYQTVNLDSLTGQGFRGSYADLPESMKKPLLLTELGWPSTGHNDQGQLYDDAQTHANTARVLTSLFNQVYSSPLYLGACYFEFCDEWWKQPNGSNSNWDPGNVSSGFPNGYADEEGFGLYSVKRGAGRSNDDLPYITFGDNPTAEFGDKGPRMPYDVLTPRQPVIDALKAVFANN